MALVNGSDYDHIDLHAAAGGDVTRHMLKDAQARQDVADLKSTLSDIVTTEEIISFDGYSSANATATTSNSPFVLFANSFDYEGCTVTKVKLKGVVAGTVSVGVIKKIKAIPAGSADRADAVVKAVINIEVGEQTINIPTPFSVDTDEYLFIGMPSDSGKWAYGNNGNDKGFLYATGSPLVWSQASTSAGVSFYVTKNTLSDQMQEVFGSVDTLDAVIDTISETDMVYKSLSDSASIDSMPAASPFIVAFLDYSNAPYTVTAIRMKIAVAGVLTIGRVLKEKVVLGGVYNANDFAGQTLQITDTGVQVIPITPIEITDDYYFFVGMPTDTVIFNYGATGSQYVSGFISVDVHNGKYRSASNALGLDLTAKYLAQNIRGVLDSVYNGKTISILGDSISTFAGYIPEGNVTYYPSGTVLSVADTWWYKLYTALGMTLNINNSWSGSRVTTTAGAESAGCGDRCEALGTNPDVIIVWMGINDFNGEVALGTYDGTTAVPTTTTTFREAYSIMLNKILTKYQTSEVWVCTLPQCERNSETGFPEINGNGVALLEFNRAILELAEAFGVKVLNHNKSGLTYQNMPVYNPDNLHPNNFGHSLIANNDIREMDATIGKRYPIA